MSESSLDMNSSLFLHKNAIIRIPLEFGNEVGLAWSQLEITSDLNDGHKSPSALILSRLQFWIGDCAKNPCVTRFAPILYNTILEHWPKRAKYSLRTQSSTVFCE